MSFTGPTDDIILQEGTSAYSFQASGTIKGGQAVQITSTMKVEAPPANRVADDNFRIIGVAAYDVTDDDYVAVYGPGNIVRVIVSGTTCTVGSLMIPSQDGKFLKRSSDAAQCASGIKAIALENQTTNAGTARVLLI